MNMGKWDVMPNCTKQKGSVVLIGEAHPEYFMLNNPSKMVRIFENEKDIIRNSKCRILFEETSERTMDPIANAFSGNMLILHLDSEALLETRADPLLECLKPNQKRDNACGMASEIDGKYWIYGQREEPWSHFIAKTFADLESAIRLSFLLDSEYSGAWKFYKDRFCGLENKGIVIVGMNHVDDDKSIFADSLRKEGVSIDKEHFVDGSTMVEKTKSILDKIRNGIQNIRQTI
jgi:hypothetical protein